MVNDLMEIDAILSDEQLSCTDRQILEEIKMSMQPKSFVNSWRASRDRDPELVRQYNEMKNG